MTGSKSRRPEDLAPQATFMCAADGAGRRPIARPIATDVFGGRIDDVSCSTDVAPGKPDEAGLATSRAGGLNHCIALSAQENGGRHSNRAAYRLEVK